VHHIYRDDLLVVLYIKNLLRHTLYKNLGPPRDAGGSCRPVVWQPPELGSPATRYHIRPCILGFRYMLVPVTCQGSIQWSIDRKKKKNPSFVGFREVHKIEDTGLRSLVSPQNHPSSDRPIDTAVARAFLRSTPHRSPATAPEFGPWNRGRRSLFWVVWPSKALIAAAAPWSVTSPDASRSGVAHRESRLVCHLARWFGWSTGKAAPQARARRLRPLRHAKMSWSAPGAARSARHALVCVVGG
jgi:hypothetical protein